MLEALPSLIQSELAQQRENLPRNPQAATQINAKIALLQKPTLVHEIYSGRLFLEEVVASTDGRTLPVVAVFPVEQMRGEALDAIREIQRALPVLETFVQTPFPTARINMWYGFRVGLAGGGGTLYMEDRTTYETRTSASRQPYDAGLCHELSHSYIGNESLTQFLELYVYNTVRGAGPQIATWGFQRDWVPMAESNKDLGAVMDVYQMIGRDAMSSAYAAAVPLRPPYNAALTPAVIQAFVDRAPEPAKAPVAQKLAAVTF
jgi:hypothetical protein